MKEATGELNTTVIVVIIVAMLAAFFYTGIWPMIRNNMNVTTKCSKAICATEPNSDNRTVDCYVCERQRADGSCDKSETFTCAWKG